jgi:hypothetical protein
LDTIAALELLIKKYGSTMSSVVSREIIVTMIQIMKNEAQTTLLSNPSAEEAKHQLDLAQSIETHIMPNNGGMWLVDLFVKEIESNKITPNGFDKDSDMNLVKKYFGSLPFIINVEGNDKVQAFNIVHADMPVNDKTLQDNIIAKKQLTEEERAYAVWAREAEYKDTGRDKDSVLTYCGHTIVMMDNVKCVRHNTNTVDLDVAAFHYGVSLAINHTTRQAQYYGPKFDDLFSAAVQTPEASKLLAIQSEVGNHLNSHNLAQLFKLFEDETTVQKDRKGYATNACNAILTEFKNNKTLDKDDAYELINHFIERSSQVFTQRKINEADIPSAFRELVNLSSLMIKLIKQYNDKYKAKEKVENPLDELVNGLIEQNPALGDKIIAFQASLAAGFSYQQYKESTNAPKPAQPAKQGMFGGSVQRDTLTQSKVAPPVSGPPKKN